MYYLEYSCDGGKNWMVWRGMEESADTNKWTLKSILRQLGKIKPDYCFRYVKTVKISYSRTIIIG